MNYTIDELEQRARDENNALALACLERAAEDAAEQTEAVADDLAARDVLICRLREDCAQSGARLTETQDALAAYVERCDTLRSALIALRDHNVAEAEATYAYRMRKIAVDALAEDDGAPI